MNEYNATKFHIIQFKRLFSNNYHHENNLI